MPQEAREATQDEKMENRNKSICLDLHGRAASILSKVRRALLTMDRRQRIVVAQLFQVATVVFLSFSAGVVFSSVLKGTWLLVLCLPVALVIMRADFETREPPLSRNRDPKKNRYMRASSRSLAASTAQSGTLTMAIEKSDRSEKIDKIDKDAWKEDVGAPQVEKAWALFSGHIVQEFIYDSWYSSLTPDTEFPASIRALLNAEFGRLSKRAKKVNLLLLASQALELIVEQIEIFRDTKDELRHGETKWSMEEASDELNEMMIRMELKKACNLHPAMRTPDGHYKVLKQLAEVAVAHLDPPVFGDKVLSRVVSRELLAGSVLRPLIQLCTCRNVQSWLLMLVERRTVNGDGQGQDVSRPSDEMRGVWAQEQKIQHFSQAEATQQELDEVWSGSGEIKRAEQVEPVDCLPDDLDGDHTSATQDIRSTDTTSMAPATSPMKSKFRGQPIATVVAAEIVNATGSFQRDFVVYSIRIGDDRGEWTVSRRYRHFEQLHRALRSLNLSGFDAELPSKRYFYRDFTPSYVEARRVALNKYIQAILENPIFYGSEPVWEFFKKRSERFQVAKNGDSVGSMVKHTFDNVVSVTKDATRLGGHVGKGVTKGVTKGVSRLGGNVGKVGKGARDYLFSSSSYSNAAKNAGKPGSPPSPMSSTSGTSSPKNNLKAAHLHLMEDEINLGIPGQRISPAYFSAEMDSGISMDSSISESDSDMDDEDAILGLLLHPAESIAGSLYDFVDCIFLLQDRGFFRRQMFALYRRLVRLLFGSGIDEVAAAYVADVREPATIAKMIANIQSFLWPGGKFVKGGGRREEVTIDRYLEPLPSPPDDYEDIRKRLRIALQDGPTSVLSKLVGRMAFFSGVDDLVEILSSQTMLTQIAYGLMELVLEHLFERDE